MIRFNLLLSSLIFLVSSCSIPNDWGKVAAGLDSNGNWEARLENEKLKVRYGFGMGEEEPESFIKEAFLKAHPNLNLAGALIDGAAHRGLIIKAEVIKDAADEKTIYLEWAPVPSRKEQFPGPAKCEISVMKDSPVLKIKYIDFCFAHNCDIGLDTVHVLDANWGGITRVYGFDKDSIPQYEDCLYWYEYGFVGCDSLHTKNGIEGDPGPLSYKGQMIMGVYNKENNLGFGRVVPAKNIRCIKILWNKGFELFPQGKNYTGYIYFFDNGEEGVLSIGKEIVDKLNE